MWLITNRGFYSAVQDENDPNVITIRARTDRHLEALMDLLPEGAVISVDEGRHTDYPCRVRVSAAEWIAIAGKLAAEVDYTNFKDSVERGKTGKQLKHAKYDHGVYMSVWGVLRRLTSTREQKQQRRLDDQRWDRRRAERGRGSDTAMAFDPWPSDDPLRPGAARSEREIHADLETLGERTRDLFSDLGVEGPEWR
jgi:hypothetical protein